MSKVGVLLQLRDTLPLFLLYPYMYSVGTPLPGLQGVQCAGVLLGSYKHSYSMSESSMLSSQNYSFKNLRIIKNAYPTTVVYKL
jgi:hypothetical protein